MEKRGLTVLRLSFSCLWDDKSRWPLKKVKWFNFSFFHMKFHNSRVLTKTRLRSQDKKVILLVLSSSRKTFSRWQAGKRILGPCFATRTRCNNREILALNTITIFKGRFPSRGLNSMPMSWLLFGISTWLDWLKSIEPHCFSAN